MATMLKQRMWKEGFLKAKTCFVRQKATYCSLRKPMTKVSGVINEQVILNDE